MAALVVLILAAGAIFAWLRYRAHQEDLLRTSGIREIDQMSGVAFEARLALLFRDLGYHVATTPRTGDYGADLILSRADERVIVQAKRSSRTVGVKAVQEVASALQFYGGTYAIVVTNAQFSQNAYTMAQRLGVALWDRQTLVYQLNAARQRSDSGAPIYQVPQNGEGWISPLLQWVENEHSAGHLRGRQILAITPDIDDEHTRATPVIRLDASLRTLDGDEDGLYTPDRFPTPEALKAHIGTLPDFGVLMIFGLEQWDPDVLLQSMFPWREDVFVLAFSAHPEHVEPVIRAQFSAEVPFQLTGAVLQ